MRVIINGACGAMGHIVTDLCKKRASLATIVALVDTSLTTDPEKKEYHSLEECDQISEVVIDFSHHSATKELTSFCISKKIPLLIATTGQTAEELEIINEAAKKIPIFRSPNMSLGIALLKDISKRVVKAFPEAEIEIVETHHDRKIDVPSGTALMLAEAIKEAKPFATYNIGRPSEGKRSKEEIGIHSLRYGNVVGVHEVIISTGNETLKLIHEADNRALFADGAMKAAEFIARQTKPGLYGMEDIL